MQRKSNVSVLLSLVVVLLVALTACNGTGPVGGTKTVKVYVSLPTGIGIGVDMLNAAQLALDEAGGQADDVQVELVSFDTFDPDSGLSPALELEAAQKAIDDSAAVAFLGSAGSDQAKEVIPFLNDVPMALVSPTATWPGLTKVGFGAGEPGIYYPTGRRNFFRVTPSDDIQGVVAARWLNDQGVRRIYLVNIPTLYSEGLSNILAANAEAQNLEVIGHDVFDPADGQAAAAALAATINEAAPDAVYYPDNSSGRGLDLILALHELNPDLLVIGGDGLAASELPEDTTLLDGIYATNVIVDPAQLATASDFVAAFRATYENEPSGYVLATYEAMQVILKAIGNAEEPTREGVLEALSNLGEMEDALGIWQFDDNGDTSLTNISIMQLQDGKWQDIETFE